MEAGAPPECSTELPSSVAGVSVSSAVVSGRFGHAEIPEPHQIRSPLIKNRSNTSPLPAVAAKCLAIDQMVFINAGDDTEQELRKWMEEHTGVGSYTGARLLGGNEAPAEHA